MSSRSNINAHQYRKDNQQLAAFCLAFDDPMLLSSRMLGTGLSLLLGLTSYVALFA